MKRGLLRRPVLAVIVPFLAVLAGCGGAGAPPAGPSTAAAPASSPAAAASAAKPEGSTPASAAKPQGSAAASAGPVTQVKSAYVVLSTHTLPSWIADSEGYFKQQ